MKHLIEKRLKLNEDSKAILEKAKAEKRELTGEEQATFDQLHGEIQAIKATIDREALQEAEERALAESRGRKTETKVEIDPNREVDASLAFRAWACGEHATEEMVAAAARIGFRHSRRELELRALSSVTATQGQASIPDELMRAYIDVQKWYGRVRNVATVIPTATGAPLPLPTVDDTSNTGEIVDDGGSVTTTADPSFGVVNLGAFKYSSKAVIVPVELLQDSSINLPVYLGEKLGQRIGRKQNADFTAGAGTTLPFGVQVRASLGKTAAATNLITFDEVIDLFHSVDVAYRDRPDTAFMMHDAVAAFARKLKDSQNRYLWEMSLVAGQPDRLFGKPVIINNDCDSAFSTNKRLMLFGAFGGYHIRDAGAPVFIRADELRVLNHQVVFLAFQRSDGNLVDTTAVRYLRTA
jgi:HK97 family phage major capsid protein